ncbi:MAG: GNAT family N-acetyltransferase [Acidiferrobacterales bacterium]
MEIVSQPDVSGTPMRALPMVRPATVQDVPAIYELLDIYARQGNLLPRSFNDLYRNVRDFFVTELDGRIAACGALEIFTEELGEVRSLVVADDYKGRGLGQHLVQHIVAESRELGLQRLMALTYVPQFFSQARV